MAGWRVRRPVGGEDRALRMSAPRAGPESPRRRRAGWLVAALVLVGSLIAASALLPADAASAAAALPGGFTQDLVVTGLTVPTSFAFLPDGRILVAEQRGTVRVIKNGTPLQTPFIDLRDRVNSVGDRGLLGLAVDPDFAANGYVYLLYTYEHNGTWPDGPKSGRLARYTAVGDAAAPSTERVLLGTLVGDSCGQFPVGADCLPSDYIGHTIADVKVAPDGILFMSAGDASTSQTASDNSLRAQGLDSTAGKVLRVDRATGAGLADNPFWTGDARVVRSKVWAYGLRNPFRFAFRPGTSAPVIGDVGWGSWEEVNVGAAGANFGWPCYEGADFQWSFWSRPTCQALYGRGASAVRAPLVAYSPSDGRSITGGAFYTGTRYPSQYLGAYFFADFIGQWIRYLRLDSNGSLVGRVEPFATGVDFVVDIEPGPDGDLYYLANSDWSSAASGQLRRIRYAAGQGVPPMVTGMSPVAGATGVAASAVATATFSEAMDATSLTASTFTLAKGGSTPVGAAVRYDPGSRAATLTPSALLEAGATYTARVRGGAGGTRDADGTPLAADHAWSFTVAAAANTPPAATIAAPVATTRFKVGDTITFSGSARDAEEGSLPAAGLAWRVLLNHCPGFGTSCHTHPFTAQDGVASGSFVVPDHGDGVSFDIVLTATDSTGATGTASVRIEPQIIRVTLATEPSGLQVIWGGEAPAAAPLTRMAVVGSTYTVTAPSPQGTRRFSSWSDGGAQQHDIVAGAADLTLTARFAAEPRTLTVRRGGTGAGTVSSAPAGIDCGADCEERYPGETSVTLTASPAQGPDASAFAGWQGACAPAGTSPTCTVTIASDQVAVAVFQRVTATVQVDRQSGLTASGDHALVATFAARPSCGSITGIEFGVPGAQFDNARVSVSSPAGGPVGMIAGFAYAPPPGTPVVKIVLERVVAAGGATVNPIRLTDGCGEWRTFVGGGPNAFR